MSDVEDEVCNTIQERAKVGKAKYGVTMEREDLSHDEWLEHLQNELLDAAVYIQRLRTREQTLEAKLRELMDRWHSNGSIKVNLHATAMSLKMILDEVSE